MTIRIPVQVIFMTLYILASWSGALGIAFAVVEWRGETSSVDGLRQELDTLHQQLGTAQVERFRSDCLLSSDTLWILQTDALGFETAQQLKPRRDEMCRNAQGSCTAELLATHLSSCEAHSRR